MVFVNGQNLGRYWKIGPQETLYLPGPWLRRGGNEVRGSAGIALCLWVLLKIRVPQSQTCTGHQLSSLSCKPAQERGRTVLSPKKIREGAALKLPLALTATKGWQGWQLNYKALPQAGDGDKPDVLLLHSCTTWCRGRVSGTVQAHTD